jgi:hypothetical protein
VKISIIYSNENKCWLIVRHFEHEDVREGEIISGFDTFEAAQVQYPLAKLERDKKWD